MNQNSYLNWLASGKSSPGNVNYGPVRMHTIRFKTGGRVIEVKRITGVPPSPLQKSNSLQCRVGDQLVTGGSLAELDRKVGRALEKRFKAAAQKLIQTSKIKP